MLRYTHITHPLPDGEGYEVLVPAEVPLLVYEPLGPEHRAVTPVLPLHQRRLLGQGSCNIGQKRMNIKSLTLLALRISVMSGCMRVLAGIVWPRTCNM